MTGCAVVGCKSIYNPFHGNISFHRVTRNKKYLPLWEQVVKLKSNSAHAKICNHHFKEQDFIQGREKRVLKLTAVPSVNVIDEDTDDDDDNENLSILKGIIAAGKNNSHTNLSKNFEMVTSCCNVVHSAKETSNMGIQATIKTDKEISLQARVKLLELRLRRRDAKISYMKTVLNMIKKHTKGTDMEYKLCCELQNISEFSEPDKSNIKDRRKENINTNTRAESPVSEDDVGSSGDEAGMFVEVVHSPNLKKYKGFDKSML